MKIKNFLIEIHLDKDITKSDLVLRRILVDTIEYRNLAEVIEETSSVEMIEVVLEVSDNKKIEDDLKDLLTSLGFSQYKIQDIFILQSYNHKEAMLKHLLKQFLL